MEKKHSNSYNYNIREYQERSVVLLKAIDDCCRQHGITYYALYGTLLGAVRHKGFIPWDDDMDIALMRDDYDLLMRHADEWLPTPFRIVNQERNSDYPKYFAKIEDTSTTIVENIHLGYVGGIYMDIFPLDDVPDNKLLRAWHFYHFNILRRLQYLIYRDPYKHGAGMKSWLPLMARKLLSRDWVNKKAQQVLKEYHGKKGCNWVMGHDDGLRAFPKSIFGKPSTCEFEGVIANAPADTKTFLKLMYGPDYMQLPPVDKRVSHFHDYCDLTKPYAEFDIKSFMIYDS